MRFSTLWKVIAAVELVGILLMIAALFFEGYPTTLMIAAGAIIILIATQRYFPGIALVGLLAGSLTGGLLGYFIYDVYNALVGTFLGGISGYVILGDVMWFYNNRNRDEVLSSLYRTREETEKRLALVEKTITESERFGIDPASFKKDLDHQRHHFNSIHFNENSVKTMQKAAGIYARVTGNLDHIREQIIQRRDLTRGVYHKDGSKGGGKGSSSYSSSSKWMVDKPAYEVDGSSTGSSDSTSERPPTSRQWEDAKKAGEPEGLVKYEGKEAHALVPSTSFIEYIPPLKRAPAPAYIRKALKGYDVSARTNSGLYADMYEAVDSEGRNVSVTVPQFKEGVSFSQKSREKIAKRTTTWKRLDHENILKVYSADSGTFPHVVTERVEGSTLAGLMEEHDLSVVETLHIMDKVLGGLSYAHSRGATHRNIHPENIYITREGAPKIADWGMGRVTTSGGMDNRAARVYAYSAPEQFDKKQYGRVEQSTDIFQLGILFYEMLTGKNPFKDEMAIGTIGSILKKAPAPPSSINPEVPRELDEMILRALEKDQGRRWENAQNMYELMKEFISAQS